MANALVISTAAAADLVSAINWHEGQEAGLGESFIRAFRACADGIVRQPDMHPVVRGKIRRALVRRFPYQVFYRAEESRVVVLTVFHSSLNPTRLQRRLRGS